ncbi:MAG: hypothetical protein WBA31_08640 [Candidatus Dormiibacterota bacterium]
MAEDRDPEGEPQTVPPLPLPPQLTRTERATWFIYGLVAILLIAIPLATHTFSLPDLAAWVLLVGTVALAAIWYRRRTLHGPEWLSPDDYEAFLKAIQKMPEPSSGEPAPPRRIERLSGPGRSGGQPPPP